MSKDEMIALCDEFIAESGYWEEFIHFAENKGYDLDGDDPLYRQVN